MINIFFTWVKESNRNYRINRLIRQIVNRTPNRPAFASLFFGITVNDHPENNFAKYHGIKILNSCYVATKFSIGKSPIGIIFLANDGTSTLDQTLKIFEGSPLHKGDWIENIEPILIDYLNKLKSQHTGCK